MIMRCAAALLIAAISISPLHADEGAADDGAQAEAPAEKAASDDVVTLGYIENVSVGKRALEMKGKLDTGADTSSVHARNVKIYKRGERDNWVKFRLVGKNGRAIRYDQNVIRFAAIKTKTGGTIRRPVIRLPLCVGGKWGVAEVNLADRGDFDYEILIGREFLADRALIDSGKKFIAEASCEPPDDE